MHYWRQGSREVDFVLQRGPRLVALEVKSGGARRGASTALPGVREFERQYGPRRSLLVGADGIPLEEFLAAPAGYWLDEALLGSTLGRWISHDSDVVATESGSVAPCVYEMIQRLAVLPDREASAALDELAADAALSSWKLNLVTARDRQRVVRRDALYRHPVVEQACKTLYAR